MPVRTCSAKPDFLTRTSYSPIGRASTRYVPLVSVWVSRTSPVSRFRTLTLAPAIDAPDASVTVPKREAEVCPDAAGTQIKARARINPRSLREVEVSAADANSECNERTSLDEGTAAAKQ